MKRWFLRAGAWLLMLLALGYVLDWAALGWRERAGRGQGVVVEEVTDVVREKGGRTEYLANPPQPTPCVRSLLPHQGQPPCWWLERHAVRERRMN